MPRFILAVYRYSRFCDLYREWEGRSPVTMRQSHVAGERLFVDYAGDRVPVVINRPTGEIRIAQILSPCSASRASLLHFCAGELRTCACP